MSESSERCPTRQEHVAFDLHRFDEQRLHRRRHRLKTLLGQDFHHVLDRSTVALVVRQLVVLLGVLGSFQGDRAWPVTSTLRREASARQIRTSIRPAKATYQTGH